MTAATFISLENRTFLSLYVDKIMITVWQVLLFVINLLTQNNTNQAEHEFDIAPVERFSFSTALFGMLVLTLVWV